MFEVEMEKLKDRKGNLCDPVLGRGGLVKGLG